ncbi:MAG TPA: phosphorylase [Trinickia sp.]|jgi:ATP adenylyltransferase|nr:phosphorylase [Trinickia sp.]
MRSASLRPGTLWPTLLDRTEHALRCGALRPIETVRTVLEDGGVRFVIRQVSSLMNKPRADPGQSGEPRPFVDPFLPYDPDLFVADVSPTHVALLNKFNVIDHHLLIVTRAFEPQEALLDLADFEAWFACLGEFDALGFYNGGREAGASQPHKHLQIVPLPLGDHGQSLPIDPLIEAAPIEGELAKLPGFVFDHAFTTLPLSPREQAAAQAVGRYRMLLEAVGLGAEPTDTHPHQSGAYNLLVTRRWMLLVPRRVEAAHGVAVNALAFAGSLFVRDAEQMTTVRRLGPMSILRDVAMPRSNTRTSA